MRSSATTIRARRRAGSSRNSAMGATFVITLREAFEAALLLGIVYTYLDKVGGRRYYGYVTLGGALGLLASIGAGVGVSFLSGPLLDLGPDLVEEGAGQET